MTNSQAAIFNEILQKVTLIEVLSVAVVVFLIILIFILASKGEKKIERQSRITQQQKFISELQNINSRQQEFIKVLKENNDYLYRQTAILREIKAQTRTETQEEKEEIKKKIEELNKMMK